MYRFEVGNFKYKYLVGPYTVGIITPSGKKHFRTIKEVRNDSVAAPAVENGTADNRLTADEVAAYVIKHRLL